MIDVRYRQGTVGIAALVAALERVLRSESAWIDLLHDRPDHNRWRRGAPRVRARRTISGRDAVRVQQRARP